jgi:hypothetical protein
VLPALPFLFVWVSRVAADWGNRGAVWRWTILSLAACTSVSSLSVYPHSLAYFHELAGGPSNGDRHLLGSNLDWGQDLLNLKRWLDEHPDVTDLDLAYSGNVDPREVGIDFELPSETPAAGWYAASISLVRGGQTWVNRPDGRKEFVATERYTWLSKYSPVDRAGYSILIYHVTDEPPRDGSGDGL